MVVINYSPKYTTEALGAGMRTRGKGKLCDLSTYKLLTPGLGPGRLPESSQKSLSQTSHLDFVSVAFTRAVTPLAPRLHFNTPTKGGEGGGEKRH